MKLRELLHKVYNDKVHINELVDRLHFCNLRIIAQKDDRLHLLIENKLDASEKNTLERQLFLRVILEDYLSCQVRIHVSDDLNDEFFEDYLNRSISIDRPKEDFQEFFENRDVNSFNIKGLEEKLPDDEDVFGKDRKDYLTQAKNYVGECSISSPPLLEAKTVASSSTAMPADSKVTTVSPSSSVSLLSSSSLNHTTHSSPTSAGAALANLTRPTEKRFSMKLDDLLKVIYKNMDDLKDTAAKLQFSGLRLLLQKDGNLHILVEEKFDADEKTAVARQIDLRVLFEDLLNCQVRIRALGETDERFLEGVLEKSIPFDMGQEQVQKFVRINGFDSTIIKSLNDALPEEEDIFGDNREALLKQAKENISLKPSVALRV
jgi:hypothetical protein